MSRMASTRFDEDGDVNYAYDYPVGPDTDMIRVVGLMELAHRRMLRDCAVNEDN